MYRTNPSYIDADNLSIWQYFRYIGNNDRMLYSSIWYWWKNTTKNWFVPLFLLGLLVLVALEYQMLRYDRHFDWALIVLCPFIPMICSFPFIWLATYYDSFILPSIISRRIIKFKDDYLPEVTEFSRNSLTNYAFERDGIEFSLIYTKLPAVSASPLKIKKEELCFIISVDFAPKSGSELLWFDENTYMRQTFIDAFEDYCKGKVSCKHLILSDCKISAKFVAKERKDPDEVTVSLDEIKYLLQKFDILPLLKEDLSIKQSLRIWLRNIDQAAPADIVAVYIGAFQTVSGYALHISGSYCYDENNDDWACDEDFVPDNNYLEIYTGGSTPASAARFQQLTIETIGDYVKQHSGHCSSLFYDKIVSFGFDDGDLIRISTCSK